MKQITLLLIVAGLALSCRKHVMDEEMGAMDKNISYPAAYVVNGESNSLSVIRLSDNMVTETIGLMSSTGGGMSMMMWPYHIDHHVNTTTHQLAIAMPGMDLSIGRFGGMAGMAGGFMIVDAIKGTMIKEVEVPLLNHNAAYSPDGREIWTSLMEPDGKVLVFDAQTYALKNTIAAGREPAEVTFAADGSKAYVANGGSDNVTIIDPVSKQVITTLQVGDNPVAAWMGHDGNMYVANEAGHTVSVIDVAANKVAGTISLGFKPGGIAHHMLIKELWVADPANGGVQYWTWDASGSTWKHGGLIATGAGAHAVAFSNDGATAYVTNQLAETVTVISTTRHTKLKDVQVGKKPNGIVIRY